MEKRKSRRITDEDVAEYIVKKVQKQAKKLKTEKFSGYSNDSNPFKDSNFNERFVWRKKILRDVAQGVPLDTYSLKAEKKRQRERMAEIEKGKKRREARALEKTQREEEMAFLARERARAEFQELEKKEEEFLFDQSKVRSEIRLHEGRVKPIDILINKLDPLDDADMKINEPYMIFKGLTIKELEELQDDLKLHLGLDKATPVHTQYWEALLLICDWELAEARKRDTLDQARMGGEQVNSLLFVEDKGIHSSIEADVMNLLQGKTYVELEAQQSRIESEMRSGEAKVVEFWESLLKHIHIFKAKALLKEMHAQILRQHLQHLEKTGDQVVYQEPTPQEDSEVGDDDHEAGSYSPEGLHDDDDDDEAAIDPEVDRAILERNRRAVLQEQHVQKMVSKSTPGDNFEKNTLKAMGAMEEGDAVFGSHDEINLYSQVCWWHDKFRPRKPKYFNRVHTGYEWNKYNQTHYDHDNPPPKTVQGYKFNIFYPDLVDKSKAPSYSIEKDGDSEGTCIIKFHGGPPYEDIAFRIVNKEWECSKKKGFKCTFDKGILHLYFNFKRYRYRR